MPRPLQPILVLPVYRGGLKFERALRSVRAAEPFFRRIVISLNSPADSPDLETVENYRNDGPSTIEVIHTHEELPWMAHQYFWLDYLERTGEGPDSWVLWFAHDDQLRVAGIEAMTSTNGSWPLGERTIYLGPWGMRYDPPGGLYDGPADAPLESWTSFPIDGPLRLSVAEWIAQQLEQPTYINMSGCVTQLASFQAMRRFPVAKPGGMRIEMATAAAPNNLYVQELDEPVVITHTSPSTDRTTYAAVARKDDAHMVAWLANYLTRHPSAIPATARAASKLASRGFTQRLGKSEAVTEDWRMRETLAP